MFTSDKTFVLFLAENETHDLGLLFINYEILNLGYHTKFLGENILLDNLKHINKLYNDITYISYFTIKPSENSIQKYLKKFSKNYLKNSNKKQNSLNTKLEILIQIKFQIK